MGKIYSVGMTKNSFDVAPEHGRTPFYVDAKHDGDNIDDQNYRLNELTGLYYLWKNEHDVGYKGLEHYRRAIWDCTNTHLLEPDEIEDILKTHDVILTDNYVFFPGTMDRYCLPKDDPIRHIERMNERWNGFGDFYWNWICTHKPSENSWCNMAIAREDVFDSYCEMCFDLVLTLNSLLEQRDSLPTVARSCGARGPTSRDTRCITDGLLFILRNQKTLVIRRII